jgi:hypothetical protein
MTSGYFPNLPVSQRLIDAEMIKAQPIESLESQVKRNVIVECILGIESIVESLTNLQFDVLLQPFYVFQKDSVLVLFGFDEVSDVLYEIKKHFLDANVIVNHVEPFLHFGETAQDL